MSGNFRTKRLTRDLRFVNRNPILHSSIAPLDENLYEWHGNILVDDVPLHYVVTFPPSYPDDAPTVTFCTAVPHPSVTAARRLCCEMLGNTEWLHDAAASGDSWSGWSSAYSPFSIMMQISAVFCHREELLEQHNGVSATQALHAARAFHCAKCGHHGDRGGDRVWPRVSTRKDVEVASRAGQTFVPLPIPVIVLSHDEAICEPVVAAAQPAVVSIKTASSASTRPTPTKKTALSAKRKKAKPKPPTGKNHGWTVVSYRKPPKQKKSTASGDERKRTNGLSNKKSPTKAVSPAPRQNKPVLPVGAESAAARKNRLRRQKKRERKQMEVLAKHQVVSTKKQGKKVATAEREVSPEKKPKKVKSLAVALGSAKQNMGFFGTLSPDVMTYLCGFLSLPDVLALGTLSRGLHRLASGAFLWRDLYQRRFPNSTPTGMVDFRHAYTLRVQGIVSELTCFHTKKTLCEDQQAILGYGVMYTRNPKTNRIDYIDVTDDLMSFEAFHKRKVRRGSKGEEIQDFLPLYLSADHWHEAFPQFRKSILRLYPETPFVEGAVDFLCAALNTRSVLLADKGVSASFKAMSSYSQIQRVFLAICNDVPGVQEVVDQRVSSFMASERNREKNRVRSLGDFLPLLLVTKAATWPQLRGIFLKEVFARNTLWACRGAPELAHLDNGMPPMRRLSLTWEGTKVSNKLIMLSSMFLNLSRRGKSLAHFTRSLDRFYGSPSMQQLREMKLAVGAILSERASWPMYFKMVCGTSVQPDRVDALLRDAVRDSRRKGYHSKHTNFRAVHSSGTSKILRKGESYTTAKDVNEVMLGCGWNFPAGVKFLDASCLIYDGPNYMGVIDFQTCYEPTGMSILHSGDQISDEKKTGEHNIRLMLKDIPKAVDNLFLVLSAWTDDLSAIRNPWIRLVDSRNPDNDLCSYTVESAGSSQGVVLAKVVRQLSGWKIIPLGVTTSGTVRNYTPIRETIKNIERTGRHNNKHAKA